LDTIGSLVDKLSIVNLKLWHVQDWVHKSESMTTAEFCANSKEGHEKVKQLAALNKQRNALMTEIDRTVHEAIVAGKSKVEERIKL
jgi:hypothetical protein